VKTARRGTDAPSRAPLRVLVVEDSEDDALLVLRELRRGGYEPRFKQVDNPEAMRQALAEGEPWDVVLSDWRMPRLEAPEALRMLRASGSEAPFIIVSGKIGEDAAVEAVKAGAHDYVMKDDLARLPATVGRGLQEAEARRERERVERSLKESERRFRSLVMNSSDMITVFAPDGTRLYASPSIERILGYDPEDMIGGNAFDLVHPDDAERVREELAERAQTPGTGKPFEFRSRHADGSWRVFESIGTNLLDDPSVGGIVFNARDITDRKRAEVALKESEERYRRLVELSPDMVVVHDGREILFANPAGAKLLGASSAEELTGKRVIDLIEHLIHPDYRETVKARLARTREKDERTNLLREKVLRLDGRVVDVEAASTSIAYGGQEATLGVVRDITVRKRAEEERDRLFELSLDLLCVAGLDGYFKRVNPAFEETLDFSGGELLAKPLIEFVHPEDRAATVSEMEALGRGARTAYFENRLLRKDGSPVWLAWKAVPVVEEDLIYATARDVTGRKQTEEALGRRDAILRAVAFAAECFLKRPSSWEESIGVVLERLGRAAEASRVYVFENYTGTDGEGWTSQRYEWVAPGISPQIDDPSLKAFSYPATGFDRWPDTLGRGDLIHGHTRTFPEGERQVLAAQDIESLAVVPVFVEGGWWGFIGFDECEHEREWSDAEIEALKAAADTLGAAIGRDRAGRALRESEERYRAVVEHATEGIFLCDADTGEILESNAAFRGLLGYSAGEIEGMKIYDLIAHDPKTIDANMRLILQEGSRFLGERQYRRKDGSLVDVEAAASVISYCGRQVVCDVVRDVTERKKARRMLEHRVNALAGIYATLTLNRPVQATLDALAARIVESTAAVACTVVLIDPETSMIRQAGSCGLPEGYTDAMQASWRAGIHGRMVRVFRSRRPSLAHDARRTLLGNSLYAPIHPFIREVRWDTVYIVPLVARDESLGAINLYYLPGTEPTADEKVFLGAVADQTAVAVENARLFAAIQEKAALEERQHLARELHDSVSQALYGIALGTRTARTLLDRDGAPERVAEWLDYVLSLAGAGLTEMQALIFELRPESLKTEGLVAALEKQAAALEARHEIPVEVTLCPEPDLPLEAKEALYRIAQEALHNTVKHAHAGRAELRLEHGTEGTTLEVSDDGVGFDPETSFPGHLGLKSMRERAVRVGGELRVRSAPGEGASIHVRIVPAVQG
jgi:PAS domain S-box-containing protein